MRCRACPENCSNDFLNILDVYWMYIETLGHLDSRFWKAQEIQNLNEKVWLRFVSLRLTQCVSVASFPER